jgi:hypothetical protein
MLSVVDLQDESISYLRPNAELLLLQKFLCNKDDLIED